jgi:hypothetical protein
MTETTSANNLTFGVRVLGGFGVRVLGGFRNLYYYRNFQGRPTAGALLPGRNPGIFPLQIDLRLHRVRADRAVSQPEDVIFG